MEEKAQTANDKPDQVPQMRQERDLEKNKEQQSTSAQVSRRRSEQSEPQQGRDRWMRGRENQGQQQTMSAGERKKRMTRMVRVWVLNEKKNLIPLTLKIGLNDNRYVEVLEGEIKEGDEIVLGMSGPEATSMGPQQTNPFQQRMPGGGGRRGF
jgi:hypothetical protein